MNGKLFGGILLIAGTAIGAGMLALPIASAQEGFLTSIGLLFLCWLSVMCAAFYMLEVCLWLPENSNLLSMSKQTLGRFGEIIAWFFYIILLYSIICAYIAGSADMFQMMLHFLHVSISYPIAAILLVCIFSYITYRGISSVDHVNRVLTIAIFLVFLGLFFSTASHIQSTLLLARRFRISIATLLIMVASFSFAIIIPSLRSYFNNDVRKIRKAIMIGGAIPFILYVLWIAIVHGILSRQALAAVANAPEVTSAMTNAISLVTQRAYITTLSNAFAVFAMLTSLLGVSLCLNDFIRDGLNLSENKRSKMLCVFLTFVPPLLIVLAAPSLFIRAVEYAGLSCVVLMIGLPSLMVYWGRYHTDLAKDAGYRVIGGKFLALTQIIIAAALILWAIT